MPKTAGLSPTPPLIPLRAKPHASTTRRVYPRIDEGEQLAPFVIAESEPTWRAGLLGYVSPKGTRVVYVLGGQHERCTSQLSERG